MEHLVHLLIELGAFFCFTAKGIAILISMVLLILAVASLIEGMDDVSLILFALSAMALAKAYQLSRSSDG